MSDQELTETHNSYLEEKQEDRFMNLPDIIKYSQSERDELLRRLLQYERQHNEDNDLLGAVIPNGSNSQTHIISKSNIINDNEYYLSLYQSKYIVIWYMISLFGAFLFSSYNYICMTYQHNDYCKDPKLDDLKSWITFIITFIMTLWYLGKISHSTISSYQLAKGALNETNNKFIKGNDNDDFEIYIKFKKIGKWILGFYLLSLIMLFLLYYFVILIATYRKLNNFIFLDPQSVIFITKYSIGIFVFIAIYFPILSAILSLFLYQRFCNSLYHISVTYSSHNKYNKIEYNRKLIKFRNTLSNLQLFLMYIPMFGPYIIVILWNWQFWLIMNLIFGHWDNGIFIWSIISSIVSSCCLVLYGLSRKKLSNYFGDIFQLCISRKILPITTYILPPNNDKNHFNYINIDDDDNKQYPSMSKWKSFRLNKWPKIRKWCINLHSVITIILCIGLLNFISQPSEYETNIAYRWGLSTVISWTIIISAGYLVSQLCSKDIHHRLTVLYKAWLMMVKIFFIRRCKFIVDNHHAANPNIFTLFQYLFTIFSVFGLIIFLMITTKFELIYFNNSQQTKIILSKLFPGYLEFEINFCDLLVHHVGIYKWKILRISFCGSIVTIFGSVIWCIVFANTHNDKIFTLEFFYIFVWIVPQLCWHNEMVQYIRLHLEWNKLIMKNDEMMKNEMNKEKSKLNNQFTISLSTLQIIQPIIILSCSLSFVYLAIFGYNLGHTPVVFCAFQLFWNIPLSILSIWQSEA